MLQSSVRKGSVGGIATICAPTKSVPTPTIEANIPEITPFELPLLTNIPKVNIPIIVPAVTPVNDNVKWNIDPKFSTIGINKSWKNPNAATIA